MCNATQGAEHSLITQGKEFSHEQADLNWHDQMKLRMIHCEVALFSVCILRLMLFMLPCALHVSIIAFSNKCIKPKYKCLSASHHQTSLLYEPVKCSTCLVWMGWRVQSPGDHLAVFFWWSFPLSHHNGFLRGRWAAEQKSVYKMVRYVQR